MDPIFLALIAGAGTVMCGAISIMFLWTKAQMNARITALEEALKAAAERQAESDAKREALEKFIRGEHRALLIAAHDRERQHDRWLRRLANLPSDRDTDTMPIPQDAIERRDRTPRPHTTMEHA